MSSLLRPVAAVTCVVLLQGLLYAIFFTRPSSVQKLRLEAESENGVGSMSYDVNQYMARYNWNWSEWQAHEDRNKPSRFEEVNRDLVDMNFRIKDLEVWMRNTSMLLEMMRHLVDSESRSNQEKLINDTIAESRLNSSSKMKVRNELMKPLDEYLQTRRNKRTDIQRGFIANVHDKLPINRPRVKATNRPLNPLEEYFQTVRNKRREIREGPIVNSLDFPYVINPGYKTCSGQKVFLIAFVPTALEHYDYRRAIRNTWAVTSDFRLPVRCIFVVGRPSGRNGDRIQQLVEMESKNFGDILQADFLDTYNNLTYKSLVGLRWVAKYCSEAKYVLKIDDDTFVNMFALLDRLEQDLNRTFSDLKIFCRAVYLDKVHRTGKWAVRESEFRHTYYPPYCSGPAYVLTMTMASQIVTDSLHVPFFHFEDVYVTGFVTMLSGDGVRLVQWEPTFAYAKVFPRAFLTRDRNKYLFAIEVNNNHLYMDVWHKMKQLYTNSTMQATDTRKRNGFNNALKRRPNE